MASYRIVVTERTELVVDAHSRREALAIAEQVQQERGPLPAGCTISRRHGPTFEVVGVAPTPKHPPHFSD